MVSLLDLGLCIALHGSAVRCHEKQTPFLGVQGGRPLALSRAATPVAVYRSEAQTLDQGKRADRRRLSAGKGNSGRKRISIEERN
jgi:hypothetical protein